MRNHYPRHQQPRSTHKTCLIRRALKNVRKKLRKNSSKRKRTGRKASRQRNSSSTKRVQITKQEFKFVLRKKHVLNKRSATRNLTKSVRKKRTTSRKR